MVEKMGAAVAIVVDIMKIGVRLNGGTSASVLVYLDYLAYINRSCISRGV